MRLFMSVDLVGSTAFKANKDYADPQNGSPSPGWVGEFRAFYKNFPLEVAQAYTHVVTAFRDELIDKPKNHPKVWKTVGDEIIFCGRVYSIEHAAASVSAFLKALERYARALEEDKKPLRLKGAGWLAAFPAPNISISVTSNSSGETSDGDSRASENDEAFEALADEAPNQFDFLGKGIDTGFRIAKNASEDRFVVSVQLGYVLARASAMKKFPHAFGYHEREILKGVIDGTPYPVISVDTEMSEAKSRLKSREAALTGSTTIQAHALSDFLETFMSVADIETPCLGHGKGTWGGDLPESYTRYERAFAQEAAAYEENIRQVTDAPDPISPDEKFLASAKSFLDEFPLPSPSDVSQPETDELSVGNPAD